MLWRRTHLDHPSPNYGGRRGVTRPDMVVIHYTGMASADAAVARLADPEAEVSAHYIIDQNGARIKMVRPRHRAWHAGLSCWGGVHDVNSHSIGIELVNPGAGGPYEPFTEAQMVQLEALLAYLLKQFAIPRRRVVGHACIAPGRKQDPGPKFDWRRLALQDLSIWMDPDTGVFEGVADPTRFQLAARRFGYFTPDSEAWCAETLAVWEAFRMRFLPNANGSGPTGTGPTDSGPTVSGVAHLERLAEKWPCRLVF